MVLPVLPIVLPLLAAALLAAIGRFVSKHVANTVTLAVMGAVTVACAALAWGSRARPILYWVGGFAPRDGVCLGISLAIDPVGAGLATLSAALAKKYYSFVEQQKTAEPEKTRELATVSDYLDAAKRVYGFTPERVSEREFKLRYAE